MRRERPGLCTAIAMTILGLVAGGCGPGQPAAPSVPPAAETTAPAAQPSDAVVDAPQSGLPPGAAAPPSVSSAAKEEGDAIVENLNAEPGMLSPILDLTDGGGRYIVAHIYETLIKLDNETLEYQPLLAKSWEISDDHLTYTFHLRDDAVFSDGTPVTAHDFKFTIDLINDPATDAASIRNYLQDVSSVEVPDDHTIRFTCSKPYFRHLLVLGAIEAMPRHIFGTGEINKHPGNRAPVGSGPYVFQSWETGAQITLARNERYWGEKPAIKKRVFKFITDDQAAFAVLNRHEIDTMDFQPEMWFKQAAAPDFERRFHKFTPYSPIPGYLSRFGYVGWNMRKPQLADKRVRQALTLLMDRETILEVIYKGLGTLVSNAVNPRMPEYDQSIAPWPFDPARARQLLDEAGWKDEDRDGVREKDGVKLEFELSFSSGVAEYEQMATVYQEELKRAGIRMTARPLEWATFQERVHNRTFDACMLAWLTVPLPDSYQLFHSTQAENGSNYPGFINAEADAIMERAREEFDRSKRVEMYHRLHAILHEEQPYTFLFSRPGLIAVDKRFENVKVYPSGLDPTEWWVAKQNQRYPS